MQKRNSPPPLFALVALSDLTRYRPLYPLRALRSVWGCGRGWGKGEGRLFEIGSLGGLRITAPRDFSIFRAIFQVAPGWTR